MADVAFQARPPERVTAASSAAASASSGASASTAPPWRSNQREEQQQGVQEASALGVEEALGQAAEGQQRDVVM